MEKNKYIELLSDWIDVQVSKSEDYTFTCTICKYSETRLKRTEKSGKTLKNKFRKLHKNCGNR